MVFLGGHGIDEGSQDRLLNPIKYLERGRSVPPEAIAEASQGWLFSMHAGRKLLHRFGVHAVQLTPWACTCACLSVCMPEELSSRVGQ